MTTSDLIEEEWDPFKVEESDMEPLAKAVLQWMEVAYQAEADAEDARKAYVKAQDDLFAAEDVRRTTEKKLAKAQAIWREARAALGRKTNG